MNELYANDSLPVGQQRIAVMPPAHGVYPTFDVQPEWTDSLILEPQPSESYDRRQETVAKAGPFRLVRIRHARRYRQGV